MVGYSKDVVQWWIQLGWRTRDENLPGSRKGKTGGCSGRAGWLDGEDFAKVRALGGLQGVIG